MRADAAYPVAIVMPALHAIVCANVSSSMRKLARRGRDVVDGWAVSGGGDAPLNVFASAGVLCMARLAPCFPAPNCVRRDTSSFRRISQRVFACFYMQVSAAWQWWNCLRAQVPRGKKSLRINYDETSICFFQGHALGNLFISKDDRATQNISRKTRRSNLTYIAFVCDDSELQPKLPQVILCNERTIPKRLVAAIRRGLQPNICVVRARSAWVNGGLCASLIRWLGEALAPHMRTHQPIFSFRACKSYVVPIVLRAFMTTRIWPHLIPASTTRYIQALDTHGFGGFKLRLQHEYQGMRMLSENGAVGVVDLVQAIQKAIRGNLNARSWAEAVDHNGLGARQSGVSVNVLASVGLNAPTNIPDDPPSLDQVLACFPRGARQQTARAWLAMDIAELGVASAARLGPRGWARLSPIRTAAPFASLMLPLPPRMDTVSAAQSSIASRTRSRFVAG